MLDARTKEKLVTNAKGDSIFDRMRRAIRALLCALVFGSAPPPIQSASSLQAHAEPSPQGAIVRSVESVGMTVSDMDRSVDFYSHVLSFGKVYDVELAGSDYEHLEGVFGLRMRVARMQLGNEFIELTEYLAPKGRPVPADSRSNDRWFQHIAIVTNDMDHAYVWLRQNKVSHASTGPQTLPDYIRPAAGVRAFYFEDPDRHPLEILQFPPDKGAAKWHQAAGNLFLGIDHTAIVVSDTDVSLKFYRDTLGFAVAGESENYGSEQEHLNNIFGSRLRITSLRASAGPGIELLEYLAPPGGHTAPIDEHSNDLVHHQTRLIAADIGDLARRLSRARCVLISPGIVVIPKAELGFHAGLLVRDPDGHPMELVEQ
jgi:catechol 2,3-dioxygenase-like lactoylglutathione lyase family enzyme